MRVSAERAEVLDSPLFPPSSFMCPFLHPGTLAAPQSSRSPASTPLAPRQPFSRAAGEGWRRGPKVKGGKAARLGALCAQTAPPPPLAPSLPTVPAPSRVTPGQGDCISETPGGCQWPLSRSCHRGGRPHSPCDFCLGSRGLPGTSPTLTFAAIAQMGS